MPTPVVHYRENIENSTLPPENIENPTILTPVMNYTENIIKPIGQNNINLEVIIIEVVRKLLSYLIFLHSFFVIRLLS